MENGVTATILFFGSARAKSHDDHAKLVTDLENKLAAAKSNAEVNLKVIDNLQNKMATLTKIKWMCEYYDKIATLSKLLTKWSTEEGVQLAIDHRITGVTRYHGLNAGTEQRKASQPSAFSPGNASEDLAMEDLEEDSRVVPKCALFIILCFTYFIPSGYCM